MNDLISRQDAIKQIQRYGVGCMDPEEFVCEIAERFVIGLLNDLPSVQPEIIPCDQCKYWDGTHPIADGRCWCMLHDSFMYYCSDAERKET